MLGARIGRRKGFMTAGFAASHLAVFDLAMPLAVASCALLSRPAAIVVGVASAILAGLAALLRQEPVAIAAAAAGVQAVCVGLGAWLLRATGSVAMRYDRPQARLRFLVLGAAVPALIGVVLRPGDGVHATAASLVALPVALASLGAWSDLVDDAIRQAAPGTVRVAAGAVTMSRGWLLMSLLTGLAATVAFATGYDPASWLLAGLAVGALRHGPRAVSAQAGIAVGVFVGARMSGLTGAGSVAPSLAESLHLALAVAVPLLFATARQASGLIAADDGAIAARRHLAEARELARRMTHLAHHDPLTGLPNRRWLLERLREALRDADAAQRRVALLFIDLDGFKAVNDTHGHAIGDALLRAVAQRLRGRVRAGDTVCRLAGDEFVVLLPSIADREAASDVAALLRAALARPFALRGRVLRVGFSGGIAVAPEDGTRAEVLLERADAAMYEAKRRGRDPAPVRAAH
jgi:diguanylate cyclase (GGDEF)-like protein